MDLKFNISGSSNEGVAAVKGMQSALKNLASASTAATATQRANLKAVAQESVRQYKTIQEAQQKAIKTANDARIATANATNSRSIARNESNSKITNSTALNGARIDTEKERQAGLAAVNAQKLLGAQIDVNIKKQREYQAALRSTDMAAQNAHRVQMRAFQLENAQRERQSSGLSTMRYALYDVSQTAAVAGAALLALPAAAAVTAVKWQASFAQVQRTNSFTGDSAEQVALKVSGMRQQFVELVQTIPASWTELTKIGALAGQIGIANESVVSFTRTVAMFASTTDVSVEDSATAFGRLNAFLPDVQGNFASLGDSILKVGVNSVATESQIVRITTQIGSILAQAKFSSKEVIGLSGALASVAVPPELSRGVVTRVFGQISRAASIGGGDLNTFAKLAGRSASDFQKAWGTEASGQVFLDLMAGIQKEGANAENVLRSVGITSVRDVPVLIRLANAADSAGKAGGLLAQTFGDAANAGGEMQRQYNIIADTVESKIQVLINNLGALGDALVSGGLGMFGDVLGNLSSEIRSFTNSLDEPFKLLNTFELPFDNRDIVGFGVAAVAAAGGLALMVSGIGRIAAGMIAIRQLGGMAAFTTVSTSLANVGNAAAIAVPPLVTVNRNLAAGATTGGVFARGMATAAGAGKSLLAAIGPIPGVLLAIATVAMGADMMKGFVSGAANAEALSVALAGAQDQASQLAAIRLTGQGIFGNETKAFISDWKKFNAEVNVYSMTGSSGLGDFINSRFSSISGIVGVPSKDFANFSSGIEQMDNALGQLSDSGNLPRAISGFADFSDTAKLTGPNIDYLIDKMPKFRLALETQLATQGLEATDENLRKIATGSLPGFTEALTGVTGIVDGAADAFEGGNEELSGFITALQTGSAAFLDFGSAIDGATEEGTLSMEKFLSNIQEQVANQQRWQTAMQELAGTVSTSFLEYLAGLGPEATDLIVGLAADPAARQASEAAWSQLAGESTDAFLARITNDVAGATPPVVPIDANPEPARAKLFAYKLEADGTVSTTTVDADDAEAIKVLKEFGFTVSNQTNTTYIQAATADAYAAVQALINTINNSSATITVHTTSVGGSGTSPTAVLPYATGGAINGPGTSTSDSIPIMASDGEYMIRARSAQKLGPNVMNYINRTGSLPTGRSTGGAVTSVRQGSSRGYSSSSSFASTATIDAATMQAMMAMADRPVYLVVDSAVLAAATSSGNKSLANKGSN